MTTKAQPKTLTVAFEFERETKRTKRFQEVTGSDDEIPTIGTLYVSKAALADLGDPSSLTLTISA